MLKIYNNKKKSKEQFIPIDENKISMYVCGPTLYDDIHIGNARPIVFFDVVYRFLEKNGYDVTYVSNITDIDDKIIIKAKAENITENELVDKNNIEFKKILEMLNIKKINKRPSVTEYMNNIIKFIEELIEKDFAYKSSNGDVYFRINKIDNYGNVSNNVIEDLIAGSRVDIEKNKENELDFVLWKKTDVGITWDASFGVGRPGWHTECVVMIRELFGSQIDIHGGGIDLAFPHHENENAQNCAISNKNIANYWMHNGFVNINSEKMSKSLNNFITVKELFGSYDVNIIRLLLLQTNYRQPINLSEEFIIQTKKLSEKITNFSNYITIGEKEQFTIDKLDKKIVVEMEDDFNTPNLISLLLESIKTKNKLMYVQICYILGLKLNYVKSEEDLTTIEKEYIKEINKLKIEKQFAKIDTLKKEMIDNGITLIQTRDGLKIKGE